MFYIPDSYGHLETARSRREAQRENETRLAQSYAFWTTKGAGEFKAAQDPFYFGCSFIQIPSFTYGAVLDENEDPVEGYFPRAHAGVYDWIRQIPPGDQSDEDPNLVPFYIGAYVYFVVDITGPLSAYTAISTPDTLPSYTIHHNLKWEGIAIKDLPTHLLDF